MAKKMKSILMMSSESKDFKVGLKSSMAPYCFSLKSSKPELLEMIGK